MGLEAALKVIDQWHKTFSAMSSMALPASALFNFADELIVALCSEPGVVKPTASAVDDTAKSLGEPEKGTDRSAQSEGLADQGEPMVCGTCGRTAPMSYDVGDTCICGGRFGHVSQTTKDCELKPCPFCGGKAMLIEVDTSSDDCYVQCQNPECCAQTICYGSEPPAIAAWNKRADTPHKPGGIDTQPRGFTAEERLPAEIDIVAWHKIQDYLKHRERRDKEFRLLVLEGIKALLGLHDFDAGEPLDRAITSLREGK